MSLTEKAEDLRKLILALLAGEPFESVKARFDELIEGVSAEEIAAMEQQLIQEGLPVAEVQRLCDLHVGVIRGRLETNNGIDFRPDTRFTPTWRRTASSRDWPINSFRRMRLLHSPNDWIHCPPLTFTISARRTNCSRSWSDTVSPARRK